MTKDNFIILKFVKIVGARNAPSLIGVDLLNRKHPKDVGLTYFAHLKFAWLESIHAFRIFLLMFVHGLIPWIWDWKFSKYLDEANKRIEPQDKVRKNSWGKPTVYME
jgi:hypothetical protein|tara:strand:+ start:724 stop:1044 length:321 start_codon:yes stop_codon:yes gene_type:complete